NQGRRKRIGFRNTHDLSRNREEVHGEGHTLIEYTLWKKRKIESNTCKKNRCCFSCRTAYRKNKTSKDSRNGVRKNDMADRLKFTCSHVPGSFSVRLRHGLKGFKS